MTPAQLAAAMEVCKKRPCLDPATVCVYLDGAGPGTPMCSPHGLLYIDDTDATWSQYRPSDPEKRCGFMLNEKEAPGE